MALFWLFFACLCNGDVTYTDVIWGNFYRPPWSGAVTITHDSPSDVPRQIWKIEGAVIPLSTTGRPSAPDPYNGFPTGLANGLDKGHLIALSNGGPDISLNVAPQEAQWQRYGGWRQTEIDAYNYAMNKYGWDSVTHASDAYYLPQPSSGGVNWIINLHSYSSSTGEPGSYTGTLDGSYSFTISNGGTVNWSPSLPSNMIDYYSKFNPEWNQTNFNQSVVL